MDDVGGGTGLLHLKVPRHKLKFSRTFVSVGLHRPIDELLFSNGGRVDLQMGQ